MKRTMILGLVSLTAAVVLIGCTRTDPVANNPNKNPVDPKASEEARAKYILASEPAGAKGVKEVKQHAKDGDEVVIVGRIGGSKEPFTKGRVSFTIVDPSFVPCSEKGEEDSETPWDFC
jgi:hypothetical protein